MRTESQIREDGFDWQNVERSFIWHYLGRDFIRQLVEYDPTYKTQLEHHLLMAFHGYSSFPSYFYQNMYIYLITGLAETKELACYADRVYLMCKEQVQKEQQSKQVYSLIDNNGIVLDQVVL